MSIFVHKDIDTKLIMICDLSRGYLIRSNMKETSIVTNKFEGLQSIWSEKQKSIVSDDNRRGASLLYCLLSMCINLYKGISI